MSDALAALDAAEARLALIEGQHRLDAFWDRLDAAERKCSIGYGCGAACISVKKECHVEARSSTGRERLQRLGQLARGEISPRGIGNLRPDEARQKARELRAERAEQTAAIKAERQRRAEEAAAAGRSRPKVQVQLRRAQAGGEHGPDGHWYPGGAWMSEGSYVGPGPSAQGVGAAAAAAEGSKDRGGNDRPPRVIRPRPPKPPPIEPKGQGLREPRNLKTRAAQNDADYFNERGYILWPRPRNGASIQGLNFVAALAQRMTTEELQWANRRMMRGVQGEARESLAHEMRMVRRALQPGTFEEYGFQKRGGLLSGVDRRRWNEAYKLATAGVWARPESEATKRKRTRANDFETRDRYRARSSEEEQVWRLNNLFRAIAKRRRSADG
jgi:hypothetical protein